MADKKEMLISVNDTELKKFSRTIKDITAEGLKMSKAFGGNDMGKGFGSALGIKSLLAMTDSMKKFRQVSDETGRALKSGLIRDIGAYEKALESANKDVQLMTENVNKWTDAASRGVEGATEKLEEYDKKLRDSIKSQQNLIDGLNQLKGGGKQGILSQIASNPFQTASIIGGTAAAVGGAANTYQNQKTLEWQNLANIRSFEGRMLRSQLGGDFSDMYYMGKRTKSGGHWINDAASQFGGQTASKIGIASDTVGNMASTAMGVMMLGRGGGGGGGGAAGANATGGMAASSALGQISGGVSGTIMGFKNMSVGGPQAAEAGTVGQGFEYMKAVNPMEAAALNFIQQTAQARVGASRALQGRHMEAWGMEGNYGMDMGQAFQRAQVMANISGDMDWALGKRSSRTVKGVRGKELGDWQGTYNANAELYAERYGQEKYAWDKTDKFIDVDEGTLDPGMARQGRHKRVKGGGAFAPDALTAAMGADLERQAGAIDAAMADKTVTSRSRNLVDVGGEMERRGWGFESAGQIFQRMAEGTGGVASGEKELKDIMAYAMEYGFRKSKMHEAMAEAISQRKVGQQGELTNFAEYAKMMYGGLNENSSMRDVRAAQSAMGFLEGMTNNQTFNIQKTAMAAQILGGQGTGMQMMGIANASYGDLLGHSATLGRLGISKGQGRQIAEAGLTQNLGALGMFGGSPELAGFNKLYGQTGSVFSALQDKDAQKQLATALQVTNKGLSLDAADKFTADLAAMGRGDLGAKDEKRVAALMDQYMGKKGDGNAEATVATTQAQLMKVYQEEIRIREEYQRALKDSLKATDVIEANKAGFEAFGDFLVMIQEVVSNPNMSREDIMSRARQLYGWRDNK